jgi:hypothetical protein
MHSNSSDMVYPHHIPIKSSREAFLSQDKSNLCESHNIQHLFAFGNRCYKGIVRKRTLTIFPVNMLGKIKRKVFFSN